MPEDTNTKNINLSDYSSLEEIKTAFQEFLDAVEQAKQEYKDGVYEILDDIDQMKINQIKEKLGIK